MQGSHVRQFRDRFPHLLDVLFLLEPAAKGAEAEMRQADLAPADNPALPFRLARADDSDPGLDTKARRIASRLVGGAVDVVAQFRKLLWRAEVEPAVRLPPDTAADALCRQAGRANPYRNRLLDG